MLHSALSRDFNLLKFDDTPKKEKKERLTNVKKWSTVINLLNAGITERVSYLPAKRSDFTVNQHPDFVPRARRCLAVVPLIVGGCDERRLADAVALRVSPINAALHLATVVRDVYRLAGLETPSRHRLEPSAEHVGLAEGLRRSVGVETNGVRLLCRRPCVRRIRPSRLDGHNDSRVEQTVGQRSANPASDDRTFPRSSAARH